MQDTTRNDKPDPQGLLDLIGRMLGELRAGADVPVELDDDLERNLGIDSLARMELTLRVERAYDVRMPEHEVQQARTPRDLWRAVLAAAPREEVALAAPPRRSAAPGAGAVHLAAHAQTLVEVLQAHAGEPERPHIALLGGATPITRTHGELLQRASVVAAALQAEGLQSGQSVALMLLAAGWRTRGRSWKLRATVNPWCSFPRERSRASPACQCCQ